MIQMIQLYLIQDRDCSFLVLFLLFCLVPRKNKQKSYPKHPTCLVLGQHASLEELRFLSTKKKHDSFWRQRDKLLRDKNSQNWTEDDMPCVKPLFLHKFPNCFLGMLSVELSEIQISNLGVLNLKCINKHISSTFDIFCPKGILTIASLRYLLDIGSQQKSQKHS